MNATERLIADHALEHSCPTCGARPTIRCRFLTRNVTYPKRTTVDVRKNPCELGADLQGGSAEDFCSFMRDECDSWSAVVKQAGIKPE